MEAVCCIGLLQEQFPSLDNNCLFRCLYDFVAKTRLLVQCDYIMS